MIKLLIAFTFVCDCYITEVNSKSCTNLPYNNVAYCEKLTESMAGHECVEDKCRKKLLSCADVCLTSIDTCKLTCGQTPIWPLPTGDMCVSKTLVTFRPSEKNLDITFDGPPGSKKCKKFTALLKGLSDQIKDHLLSHNFSPADKKKVKISIKTEDTSVEFTDDTDESYTLYVSGFPENIDVRIVAKTFFGARHGMETLLQLIVYDEKSKSLITPIETTIHDKPEYSYRGVMLDTGRSYIPVTDIKRIFDAMAMNKMNSFHWHMTDTTSYPYVSKKHPELSALGSYTKKEVYTWNDLKEIVEHARSRGIRVIPALAGLAIAGKAWNTFTDPITKRKLKLNCGLLDGTLDAVYDVLGDLYKELAELFDSDLFHLDTYIGGLGCWTSPDIERFTKSKKVNDLLEYFVKTNFQKLLEANSKVNRTILWSSAVESGSSREYRNFMPPNNFIVQYNYGNNDMATKLATDGYKFIVSADSRHYLGHGFENGMEPYQRWHQMYMADPVGILRGHIKTKIEYQTLRQQILGVDALLFSESADAQVLDSRLWPRTAAVAERSWSNPKTGWREAKSRLLYHRNRMAAKGIAAEMLEPLWCLQNDGECVVPAA